MSEANDAVHALLRRLVEGTSEVGLQVAAFRHGELVVDTWAGLADEESGRPVDGDTMFTVFSVGKGMVATCIHILADRGRLDYEDPIAKYWPEFAARGKSAATIRDALTHQTGIPQMPEGYGRDLMLDWQRMTQALAAMEPLWEPGTAAGYHGVNYGYILGEVLRRVDGRSIDEFLQDELCAELNIDSMFFGVPADQQHRIATLKDHDPLPPDHAAPTQYLSELKVTPEFNSSEVRAACLPAHGGIMNARSIATHYAMLLGGGEWRGARVLGAERVRIATAPAYEGDDLITGLRVRRALGYSLGGSGLGPIGDRPDAFGHGGVGGSIGFADPGTGIAFGLTKNYMEPRGFDDDVGTQVYRQLLRGLGEA